ncbi:MAG: cytochrome d ubiquinol oxidase subunit II [Methylococcales bacterium]|nr:cytochrome d ubiquinol oxidase subunit II [Methylococcales bacterium]
MIFDYETLRIIWWGFLGFFLISFAITGGFDLGAGILLPFIAENDDEKRVVINIAGATWLGNQAWLILVIGTLFAAWPMVYAVLFSGFYLLLLLALFGLCIRALSFSYRSQLSDQKWRNNWDKALFVGSILPTFIFGVVFGNLLKGIPFQLENDLSIVYLGSFWSLFSPFALLVGLLSVSMLAMHGAVYLQIKTEGAIQKKLKKKLPVLVFMTLGLFALAGHVITFLEGYHFISEAASNDLSTPLTKFIKREPGLWLDNYGHLPTLMAIPATTFVSGFITITLSRINRPGSAFIFSAIAIATIIFTVACSLFPFIIPSSVSVNSSLTLWDASASQNTLNMLFWVTAFFLPLITIYSNWTFRVLRGKITVKHIQKNNYTAY